MITTCMIIMKKLSTNQPHDMFQQHSKRAIEIVKIPSWMKMDEKDNMIGHISSATEFSTRHMGGVLGYG